jgi:MerR family gold-responsive transcriptional activator of gol and ges genes
LIFQLLEGLEELYRRKAMTAGYSIGQAAQATGLTAKAIRYYEQIGLIPKARRRTGAPHTGGDRVYSEIDIGRLRFIRHARLVDLSLDDIRTLLKIADTTGCPSEHPAYSEVLRGHIRRINERINHLLGLRSIVHELLNRSGVTHTEPCTWDTCSCMRSERSSVSPEFKVSVQSGSRQ